MATHELKVWPLYYNRIVNGYKTVELRLNDRDYQTGDILVLNEWNPAMGMYTGRSCERMVTNIIREGPWLADGYVAMSIRDERKTLVDKHRLDALEALAEAVKAYTVNWGRTRYGSFFRDGEPPDGTADRLYGALEVLSDG